MFSLITDPFSDVTDHNQCLESHLNQVRRDWPRAYRVCYGTRFQLPDFRQPDYPRHVNAFAHDAITFASRFTPDGVGSPLDDGNAIGVCFTVAHAWVALGQVCLCAERELAEALLRTELPESFVPSDIRWKRNAFRIFLPSGLFSVETDFGLMQPTCITVVRYSKGALIPVDTRLKQEAFEFADRMKIPWSPQAFDRVPVRDHLTISIQARPMPEFLGAFDYYTSIPLNERTLTDLAQETSPRIENSANWNLSEKAFLLQIRHLVLNAVLFMGSLPMEYTTEVIRPLKEKKGRFKAEIRRARFLGQDAYRPATRPREAHEPTGHKLPAHWRSGHWRRQVFGPGHSQRKLIWIQPYRTHGGDNEAAA